MKKQCLSAGDGTAVPIFIRLFPQLPLVLVIAVPAQPRQADELPAVLFGVMRAV